MRTQRKSLKEAGRVAAVNLATVVVVLLAIEAFVRIGYPEIHPVGTDEALIDRNAYGSVSGLNPGASGTSNGALFEVDRNGFIDYGRPFDPQKRSVLLLGDSVTMGIGVEPDSTFAGRIAASLDSVNVLNASLMGYGSYEYASILETLTDTTLRMLHIDQVVLLWCLNDVYSNVPVAGEPGFGVRGASGRALNWLRRYVRTYHALKSVFFDRPKTYFLYDEPFYRTDNDHFRQAMEDLRRIQDFAKRRGFTLDVVMLPYEYQIRDDVRAALDAPQRLLTRTLGQEIGISVHDAGPFLKRTPVASSRLYLFGDGIHFSSEGHRQAARFILSVLENEQ